MNDRLIRHLFDMEKNGSHNPSLYKVYVHEPEDAYSDEYAMVMESLKSKNFDMLELLPCDYVLKACELANRCDCVVFLTGKKMKDDVLMYDFILRGKLKNVIFYCVENDDDGQIKQLLQNRSFAHHRVNCKNDLVLILERLEYFAKNKEL